MPAPPKRCAAFQPHYLPTVQDIGKLISAEILLFADHLQYSKQSLITRAILPTPKGPRRLTIPIRHDFSSGKQIYLLQMDTHEPWWRAHLRTLEHFYKFLPYFDYYYLPFARLLQKPASSLADFLFTIWDWHREILAPDKSLQRSSRLNIQTPADFQAWIAEQGNPEVLIVPEEKGYYEHQFGRAIVCRTIFIQELSPIGELMFQPQTAFLPLLFALGPEALSRLRCNLSG